MWAKLNARIAASVPAWLTPRLLSWILCLLCGGILLWRYPLHFLLYGGALPTDFGVYFHGWERILAGLNPYVPQDPSPYKYAPGILALVSLLPSHAGRAWAVFSTVSILLFTASLIWGANYRSWRQLLALLVGLALGWKGLLETLDYGQTEVFIFGVAVLAGVAVTRFPFIAGFLAGMLPWIKLPWGLLIVPLLAITVGLRTYKSVAKKGRRISFLLSGYLFASMLWGAAVPSILFGPDHAKELSQAWVSLLKTQPSDLYTSDINQSLWMSLTRWTHLQWVAIILGIAVAVALLVAAFRFAYRTGEQGPESSRASLRWMGPWLVLTQLLNPLAWRWGSIFLVSIPFSAIRPSLSHRWLRVAVWCGVLVLWLLQLNPVTRGLGFGHWTLLHGAGIITTQWLMLIVLALA